MGEVLTCLEHQSIPVQANRQNGDFALTVKQARQLETAAGIPADAFRWGNRSIQWRQFCGIVQLGDLTLEILPKIHGKESDPGACRATLVKMLHKAGLMKVHHGGGAALQVQRHSLLDIFILEFSQLVREQVRMGKPRDYRLREDNLRVIKGKLDIGQQLRQNLCHRERLYCQFDELTEDILINRIVKYTLRNLLPLCRANATKKAVLEQLMHHDDVRGQPVEATDLDRIILTRTNARYEPVLAWCRLFLNALNPDVAAGDHALLAILFDMNNLFERWLAAELRPIAHRAALGVRQQSPRKYLAYRPDVERPAFQARPDISLVNKTGAVAGLIDAKWKLLEPEENKLGISQADLYQMAAYANLYHQSRVVLAYPRQAGMQPLYRLVLSGARSVEVLILSVDIDKPVQLHGLELTTNSTRSDDHVHPRP